MGYYRSLMRGEYSMAAGQTREHMGTDFTEGSIMPMLLRFMLPFLLASILNSILLTGYV